MTVNRAAKVDKYPIPVIKTDHKLLTHIISESRATPTRASGCIQRWALTLGGYDYEILYLAGRQLCQQNYMGSE